MLVFDCVGQVRETVDMGWSEQYWEDVKAELVKPVTGAELDPADERETLGAPAKPADAVEKDLQGS
jgi:hypothetical protein